MESSLLFQRKAHRPQHDALAHTCPYDDSTQHARAQAASSSQEAAAFRAALEHALANARQSRDRQEVDGANAVERAHRLIPDQGQGSGGREHDPPAKAQQSKARASLSRRLGSRIGKVAGVSR